MHQDSQSELVSQLANDYLDRWRKGENPELAEYIAKHPELESDIREVFPMLLLIEDNAAEKETAKSLYDLELERLGDFVIEREIGRGGMGVVYEARQESLGRQVALKVCPLTTGMSARNRERFRRESRSAAMLHHTNIVPVFAVGEEDGMLYYAMQFIRGATLNDVIHELRVIWKDTVSATTRLTSISRSAMSDASAVAQSMLSSVGPSQSGLGVAGASGRLLAAAESADTEAVNVSLPGQSHTESSSSAKTRYWESVARIGMQVADALAYAHSQGTLHRDIKPSNLMLDSAGIIWVMDFGLAKSAEEDDLTQAGELIGTLRYMPPEQTLGETDAKSDIYSLGLTLYELLALKPAFPEFHRTELLRAISEDEPVPPRKVNPRVPRDLETIVLKAIEKEPSRRYESARDLERDLYRFLSGEPILARRVSALERTVKWIQRRPSIASLLTALALLFCISYALIAWKWTAAERANELAQDREIQAIQASEAERKAAAKALQQRILAEDRLEKSEDLFYRTAIARAELTSTTDPSTADQLLNDLIPETGEVDRRDWEWGYLKALVNQQSAVFRLGSVDAPWVWALAFSDDNSFLAIGTGRTRFVNPTGYAPKGSVTIWNVRTGEMIRELDVEYSAYHLDFSSDGHKLIVSEVYAYTTWEKSWPGHKSRVWDLSDGSPSIELDITNGGAKLRPTSMRFVADDELIAGELRSVGAPRFAVWDASSGARIWEVEGAELARVEAGETSVSLHRPQEPCVSTYDLYSGEEIGSRPSLRHTGVLSPNLRWLLDVNDKSELILRDLEEDTEQPLSGDDGFAVSVHLSDRPIALFSHSGDHFFVGATDGTIRQYATYTKKLIRILRGHVHPIQMLAQSSDGSWLASGDWNGEVRLWKPEEKSHLVSAWPATPKSETTLEAVSFRWEGTGVVGVRTGWLSSFDAVSGARLKKNPIGFSKISPYTRNAAFDARGELLAYKHGYGQQVRVIRVSDQTVLCTTPSEEFQIGEVAVSGNGKRFAFSVPAGSGKEGCEIKVYSTDGDGEDAKIFRIWNEPDSTCTALDLDVTGRFLAVAGSCNDEDSASGGRKFVKIYGVDHGEDAGAVTGGVDLKVSREFGPTEAVEFSPDGSRIAVCSVEGKLQIFDAITGALENETFTPQAVLCDLAWNPSATRIAGADRQSITLWNADAELVLTLKGDSRFGDLQFDPSVAFSPDGSKIVASQWNDKINVWSTQDPRDVKANSGTAQLFRRRSESALESLQAAIEADSNHSWSYAARGQLYAQEGISNAALEDYREAKRRLAGSEPCTLFYGSSEVIAPGVDIQKFDSITIEAWIKNWDHGFVASQIPADLLRFGSPEFWLTDGEKFFHALNLGKIFQIGPPQWIHVARCYSKDRVRVYAGGELRSKSGFPRKYRELAPMHIAGNALNAIEQQGIGLMKSFRVSTRDIYSGERFEPPQEFESTPDTFLLYDFTRDTLEQSSVVLDRSGNGNHGVLKNAWWIPPGQDETSIDAKD